MLLQTNSYVVPKERRAEHARLLRRFRQVLARLGCDSFEVYEQVGPNWNSDQASGRFVQIMRFRDRRHQLSIQAAEQSDPAAQSIIAEFCDLINFPYQQQHGYFAVGFYTSILPLGPMRYADPESEESTADQEMAAAQAAGLASEEETHEPEASESSTASYPRAVDNEAEPIDSPAAEQAAWRDGAEDSRPGDDEPVLQEHPDITDSGEVVEEFGGAHAQGSDESESEPGEPEYAAGVQHLPEEEDPAAIPEGQPARSGQDEFDSLLEQHFGSGNGDRPGERVDGEDAEPAAGDPEIGKVLDAGLLSDPDLDVAMPAELIDDSEEDAGPPARDPHHLHGGHFEDDSNHR